MNQSEGQKQKCNHVSVKTSFCLRNSETKSEISGVLKKRVNEAYANEKECSLLDEREQIFSECRKKDKFRLET